MSVRAGLPCSEGIHSIVCALTCTVLCATDGCLQVRLLDEQAGVGGDDLGALLCMHPDLLSSHSRLPRSLGFFRETVGLSARQLGLMLTSFPQLLGYSRAGLEGKWAFYTEQWGDDLQPLVEFPRYATVFMSTMSAPQVGFVPFLICCRGALYLLLSALAEACFQALGLRIPCAPWHPEYKARFLLPLCFCVVECRHLGHCRFFSYSLESRIQLRTAVLEKEGLMDDFSLQRMLECSDEAFSSRVKTTLAKKLLSS